jgi:hypothetical protein
MRLLKVMIISLLICSCDLPPKLSETQYLSQDLKYFKDDTTNLCFAGVWVKTVAATLANVPCTKEVEQAAHHFNSKE